MILTVCARWSHKMGYDVMISPSVNREHLLLWGLLVLARVAQQMDYDTVFASYV